MSEERVLLEESGVTVTTARFMVGAQTYAMSSVNSVASFTVRESRLAAGCGVLIGVGFLLFGASAIFEPRSRGVGILLVLAAVALFVVIGSKVAKHTYAVRLTTSSGQVEALQSKELEFVQRVVKALNDAIVARG